VRSYFEGASQACDGGRIELVLKSDAGGAAGALSLPVVDGLQDLEWPLTVSPGQYTLEVHRVDCGGVRSRVAEVPTEVTDATRRKQVYLASALRNQTPDPRFVEIDTYRDAAGVISARREDSILTLTNLDVEPIRLCRQSTVRLVEDEFLLRGQWERRGSAMWGIPADVSAIDPRTDLVIRPSIIKKYVPPDSKPTQPDAVRVRLAVQPQSATHVVLGEVPRAFIGFPGCDFLYVPREVTKWDRVWDFAEAEP
jgi:hypothetical protein